MRLLSRRHRPVLLLLLISGGVRLGGWQATCGVEPWGDEYTQLAHALDLADHGVQHVWWPPVTVWISAAVFRLSGGYDYPAVRLLWLFLDVLNVALVYSLSRRWFDGSTGFWAACLYALYPAAIARAVYVTSEVPSILFGLLALTCLALLWDRRQWRWAPAAGWCLGLATLSRGAMLPLLFLFPAVAAISELGGPRAGDRMRAAAAMLAAGLVVWLPWVARNRLVGGQWVLVSTNAAFNLRLSAASDDASSQDSLFLFHPSATPEQRALRREIFSDPDRPRSPDGSRAAEEPPAVTTTPAEEFDRNRTERRRALEAIARDPLLYVISSVGRFARFWALDTHVKNFMGRERRGRLLSLPSLAMIGASNAVYVFAVLMGVVGFVTIDQWRVKLISAVYVAGPLIAYTLVYSKPRYHLLVMPLLLVLAVWAVRHVGTWWPRLTRPRVVVIAVGWSLLAWCWTAWVIFCLTSRMGPAAP